jgi:hypothetical protein
LKTKQDAATGVFGSDDTPAFTALAAMAIMGDPLLKGKEMPGEAKKAYDFLLSSQMPNGSICKEGKLANYNTSLALSALTVAVLLAAHVGAAGPTGASPLLQRFLALDDPTPTQFRALRHLEARNEKFDKSAPRSKWHYAPCAARHAGCTSPTSPCFRLRAASRATSAWCTTSPTARRVKKSCAARHWRSR